MFLLSLLFFSSSPSRPVDPEEVPDYYELIKKPMSLELMLQKVESKIFLCRRKKERKKHVL